MKKKNKKNHIRMRFSTLLLCCLAILLCTAPALKAYENVPADETRDIDYPVIGGFLSVNGTANLLPGASAQYIYVYDGGTLNMYSGTIIGTDSFIIVCTSGASMTVYGTGFKVDGEPCEYGEVTLTRGRGTLTGDYDYYGETSEINLPIISDTPINLLPPPSGGQKEITIDIKPGGNPNNINLKSKGVVPVAVLTTESFDAGDVDPETVEFAGAEPVRWRLCDVDDDGDNDILFHFKTQDLQGLDEDSTEATLTGETNNEEVISGTDTVRIVSPKKKK